MAACACCTTSGSVLPALQTQVTASTLGDLLSILTHSQPLQGVSPGARLQQQAHVLAVLALQLHLADPAQAAHRQMCGNTLAALLCDPGAAGVPPLPVSACISCSPAKAVSLKQSRSQSPQPVFLNLMAGAVRQRARSSRWPACSLAATPAGSLSGAPAALQLSQEGRPAASLCCPPSVHACRPWAALRPALALQMRPPMLKTPRAAA